MPQDERYFRQIFSGELSRVIDKDSEKKYSYYIHTPYYAIDINRDGAPEQIVFVKKDSEDWVEIYEEKVGIKTKVFSYRFETKGFNSELFRIELKKLSAQTSILIMYYYEGLSRYTEMQGTSRVYAVTIDNNDLLTMTSFKGPSFFEEHKSLKGHYHLRNYQVYLQDLNKDDSKELIVKYRETSQVFVYNGNGKWKTFKN
ncbi:MAG: hypothetical protein WC635_13605 [Bacteriovorax sp.]|jgi:hypothetical protein